MMYFDEPIVERFGLPRSMCSCPFCGRVYGTRLTGKRVEVVSQLCERCYSKEYPLTKDTAEYQDAETFVAEHS